MLRVFLRMGVLAGVFCLASPATAQADESAGSSGGTPLAVGPIDLAILAVYLIGIVALGCWAGRRRKATEGSGYFLADKALTWPVIGLALFSTNISTTHVVSLAQSGYQTGFAMGNFEWAAPFTLIALSLFFAPFYIRSRITTLPDFLEQRYCRGCRDWLAAISIFSAVFIHLGFTLFTGALVLEGFLLNGFIDNPENYRWLTIIVIAGITGLYTIIGGLLAVVWTESVQTIVLLVGSICITVIGFHTLGGWGELQTAISQMTTNPPPGVKDIQNHLLALRPHGDASTVPWYGVVLGYPIIGLWYWCTDQTIVQRVLGAKDERHARLGPIFAGFIKILPMFIFVLPGVICLALIHKGFLPALPVENGEPKTGDTLALLINHLLPTGLKGLMAAALLAALMSTVSGALNSIATLFSYDLYKRWAPDTPDRKLVFVGRVVTFVAMVAAIVWSPFVGGFESIFEGIQQMIAYFAPPITAIFVWGVFSRRVNATGALITAWVGSLLGLVVGTLDLMHVPEKMLGVKVPALMIAFYLFIFCSILIFLASWSRKWTRVVATVGVVLLAAVALGEVFGVREKLFLQSDGTWCRAASWVIIPTFLFTVGSVFLLPLSLLLRPQQTSEGAAQLVWKSPLDAVRGPWQGWSDYRLLSAVLAVTMVVLYWAFS
ncbi:MAG: sodium/solute symporter [Pirellulales bacterium]|nr:sodium/solute symporter [Pirellulales bacterium]